MEQLLTNHWAEYENLKNQGDHLRAFFLVAEIYSILNAIPVHISQEFRQRCLTIGLDQKVRAVVHHQTQEKIDWVNHVLSIGTHWTFEEFVGLLTTKIQIDLLIMWLSDLGIHLEFEA